MLASMKCVLAIIGIGLVVAGVLLGIPYEQENKDAVNELERFGNEVRNTVDNLEKTGDKAAAIATLRYQADAIAESVESFRANGH